MFFNKSLLAAISAAMFVGSATAFTGFHRLCWHHQLATNGPFAVSIPSTDVGTHVCCQDSITVNYNGKSVAAIFNGIFDAGAGTDNIQLSQVAFAQVEDNSSETPVSPVTWAFN
ncbi:hypothetical protein DFH08DRAFT_976905 [Mycena albidolilacea]|uniref:Uncharacterized protein n=1 Tax=Mycena albidolilacea TaxID=1033008 RepID=A0AAD7E9Z6_9AGAR|nr:hypothetical protein DFH08DRAFT_976905 [Mycena albidolilacea]